MAKWFTRCLLLALLMAGIVASNADAATLWVQPGVSGYYWTIAGAIEDANDYDVVMIYAGVYTGEDNTNLHLYGKKITVAGYTYSGEVIIDCGGEPNRAFKLVDGETRETKIKDITMRNGSVVTRIDWNFELDRQGGLMKIRSSPTIENCIFENGKAIVGANIHIWGYDDDHVASPLIKNCIIRSAASGGAMMAAGWSNAIIEGCEFYDNPNGAFSGVYYTTVLKDCLFYRNRGSAACQLTNTTTVENCTFANNDRLGVYITGEDANITFSNNVVAYNGSYANDGGLGVYDYQSDITFSCNAFFANDGGSIKGVIDSTDVDANTIFENPYFCYPTIDDYGLRANSPLLPENSPCGVLIGALGLGCGPPPPPINTSCPFLYVKTQDGFLQDNTILTQSEDPLKRDQVVTDFYHTKYTPYIENGSVTMEIREIEFERSYIDHVSLLEFKVPDDLSLAVSSDGQFGLIDKESSLRYTVMAGDEDITAVMQPGDNETYFGSGPFELAVANGQQNNDDDIAIIIVTVGPDDPANHHQPPNKAMCKTIAPDGLSEFFSPVSLTYQGENGEVELVAAPRSNSSEVCFVVPKESGAMTIAWENDITIDGIIVTPVLSDAPQFVEYEPGTGALNKASVDMSKLSMADERFVDLMPEGTLEMVFSGLSSPEPGTHTEYVFKTTGYYTSFTDQHDMSGLPGSPALYQNYPNPFNPNTYIPFSLPSPCDVKIEIVNVLGQRVTTLVDRAMETGYHAVEWDGRNDSGGRAASGIYFVRLETGNHVETRRMMLLK